MAEVDTNIDPAKKGSYEFSKLETYGDLKKLIQVITLKQKGKKIVSQGIELGVDQLLGLFPGASNIKTAFDFFKSAISKPDTKKTNTWLDKLDIDDEMSNIVDDTVENGFMKAMAAAFEAESDTKPLEPDFNMNARMVGFLQNKYKGRTVAGIKENKKMSNLKEYIKTLVRELLDEESTTAGVPGYLSPMAFSKKGQKSNGAIEAAKSQGMKLAPTGMPSDSKVYDYKSFFGKKPTYKMYKENMSIKDIIEQELLNEATYKQFKKEVKHRTKAEQLHKAMREVKRKINEIDRIVDYTQRMKQELSEGDGVAYWGRTEKAVAQIAEMVNHLTNKINNLKQ
jgi:hypothetical protein